MGMSKAQAGRLGAHVSWARTEDRTAPATNAFLAGFEQQVGPEGRMDPETRAKAAVNAQRAFMQRIAQKGARARSR